MGVYKETIREYESRMKSIKEGKRYVKIMFGGIEFNEDISPDKMTNNQLLLSHCYVHNLNENRKKYVPRDLIMMMHSKIIPEMQRRGIGHHYYDDIDGG